MQVVGAADGQILFGTYLCTAFGRFTRCYHVHSVGIGGGVVTVSLSKVKVYVHFTSSTASFERSPQAGIA